MTTERKYGKPEGLADRLDEHAERMAKDKRTPWLGLGLYDDLQCAARQLRGQPEPTKPSLEFDL
jgi:hypothetical protein